MRIAGLLAIVGVVALLAGCGTVHADRPHRLRALRRVKPGPTEAETNPRARSAVMRVAERTDVETVGAHR